MLNVARKRLLAGVILIKLISETRHYANSKHQSFFFKASISDVFKREITKKAGFLSRILQECQAVWSIMQLGISGKTLNWGSVIG
jgi:hypothetical protein